MWWPCGRGWKSCQRTVGRSGIYRSCQDSELRPTQFRPETAAGGSPPVGSRLVVVDAGAAGQRPAFQDGTRTSCLPAGARGQAGGVARWSAVADAPTAGGRNTLRGAVAGVGGKFGLLSGDGPGTAGKKNRGIHLASADTGIKMLRLNLSRQRRVRWPRRCVK